jgi:glycerol uptake facilitator-like aquaporin
VSGGHFNPAVTVGLATARRFAWRDVPAYVVTQVVASAIAATVLFVIANYRSRAVRRAAALGQLWVFWLAPLAGGLVAGATYVLRFGKEAAAVPLTEATEG